jgi:hypothetical protein
VRVQSNDLPQADRIESVVQTCVAVFNGATTDMEIANSVNGIEGDSRQGRYYRRAAEMLGFIRNDRNNSSITPLGEQIARNPVLSNPQLISAVLGLNVYQKLFPYFQLYREGLTRDQLQKCLQVVSDPNLGLPMITRRMATITSWLRTLRIIEFNQDRYILSDQIIPQLPIINITDLDQPLLPRTGDLTEYEEIEARTNAARRILTIYKDQTRLERSTQAHRTLIRMVADRIRKSGGIPKSNQIIDLATSLEGDFIFEMKSTTPQNLRAQVRKGISQLYEYRYIQNKPEAVLVLVIENPIVTEDSWMIDYMENDRNINLIWDGNESLYGTAGTRTLLPFLNLQP